jgi:hypothetical protein
MKTDPHLQTRPINWRIALPAIVLITTAIITFSLWAADRCQ